MSEALVRKNLKDQREQREVVLPLVLRLLELGWAHDQLLYGRNEYRIPKSPSARNRREKGESYEYFPCDVAVFDGASGVGESKHLLFIIETKLPNDKSGLEQLETYLGLEPHARCGILVNNALRDSLARFLYRNRDVSQGNLFITKNALVADLPGPQTSLDPEYRNLTAHDLVKVTRNGLKGLFQDLLDRIVAADSRSTRRENQLDQICNLILLKLDSDKNGLLAPHQPLAFQARSTPAETARYINARFDDLTNLMPEVFSDDEREIRLNDETIQGAIEALQELRLLDESAATVSYGFQTLRSAALKQGEGQYFTPQPVIEAGVKLLDIKLNEIIIDPACGTGGFLIEALSQLEAATTRKDEVSRWAQKHLFGIDKDAVGVKLTKAVMQILGDGSANCVRGDAIRTDLWVRDYPGIDPKLFRNGRFHVVVTNPPFGKNLKIRGEDARSAGLSIARISDTAYRDLEIGLLFLERAYQLVKTGGRIGIILPETYFFSPNYRFVMEWLKGRLKPKVVLNVPMEAFQGFCRAKTNFYVFEKVG